MSAMLQLGEGLGSALGHDDGVASFEKRRQRERIAEVVVDDEDGAWAPVPVREFPARVSGVRNIGFAPLDPRR